MHQCSHSILPPFFFFTLFNAELTQLQDKGGATSLEGIISQKQKDKIAMDSKEKEELQRKIKALWNTEERKLVFLILIPS